MESGGTVSSCASGHPVSPGAGYCASCGEDVRPRCYQGHRSDVGSRFCETCGALLEADPAAGPADLPTAVLVTEYATGSFSAIIEEDAGSRRPAAEFGWLAATPVLADRAEDLTGGAQDLTGGAQDLTGGAQDLIGGAQDLTGGART